MPKKSKKSGLDGPGAIGAPHEVDRRTDRELGDTVVRIAGFVPCSQVNGPGRRIAIWTQGCDLACPGCFNPHTHDPGGGNVMTVQAVLSRILAARQPKIDGITFSGGEPFQQAMALALLARAVKASWPTAHLMAFTGYPLEMLTGPAPPPGAASLLAQLDLLVDGRFDARQRAPHPWRRSGNQRVWILGPPHRRGEDLADEPTPVQQAEIHIEADGRVLLSGFPDADLLHAVRALEADRTEPTAPFESDES